MTSSEENVGTTAQEAWVKPEIVSFEPVSATKAATHNAGDGNNNNS